MHDRDQKYYLCVSGEVKKRAEEHRRTFLRLRERLWKFVRTTGAEEASVCDTMMLLRGIRFKYDKSEGKHGYGVRKVPSGWTKPDRDGLSRPKRGILRPEGQKLFTPYGSYMVETHEELKPFRDWLKCPFHYHWKGKDGRSSGSSSIGRIFADTFVYWYDPNGPIMLILPDVAAAKARARKEKQIVEGNVLDWTPPKGLKEILKEEWDLMAAKHRVKTKKAS